MKRRHRSNSVDADVHELETLRRTMRGNEADRNALIAHEAKYRKVLLHNEGVERGQLRDVFVEKLRRLDLRARVAAAAQPKGFVAELGNILAKSREQERQTKAQQAREMHDVKQQAVNATKRKLQRLRERHAAQDESLRQERLKAAASQREVNSTRHAAAKQALADERAATVLAVRQEGDRLRTLRKEKETAERQRHRRHIDDEKEHSCSPSLFLKLPPLFGPGERSTPDVMLQTLRKEDE